MEYVRDVAYFKLITLDSKNESVGDLLGLSYPELACLPALSQEQGLPLTKTGDDSLALLRLLPRGVS
jgi:hypothetical protein